MITKILKGAVQNLTLLEKVNKIEQKSPYTGQTSLDQTQKLTFRKPARNHDFRRMLKGGPKLDVLSEPPKPGRFRAILRTIF